MNSPYAQTVDPLHALTVSQQKAALVPMSLQQPLRMLFTDFTIIDGTDKSALHHVVMKM